MTGVSEEGYRLTVQLLEELRKYDQIPTRLFNQLQRVLPLAERVADKIVREEADILQEIIVRMFEVMQRVAEYSRDYVRRGHLSRQSSGPDLASADDCRKYG